MSKRSLASSSNVKTSRKKATSSTAAPALAKSSPIQDRLDPVKRGIYPRAVQADIAPSSRATCVDCSQLILAKSVRWGITYAGNPLPSPVLPLYGSHPMVLWCHANCGRAFVRLQEHANLCDAARTCHACTTTPDIDGVRLLCGGGPDSRGKIREHAFHVACWKAAIDSSALAVEEKRAILDVLPRDWKRSSKTSSSFDQSHILSFAELTEDEQTQVLHTLGLVS